MVVIQVLFGSMSFVVPLVGISLSLKEGRHVFTLPKTNIAPENRPGPKKKLVYIPTIRFQVLC